jgi:serine/threonine protein kinase
VAIKQIQKKNLITEELELQLHEIHVYQVLSDEAHPGIVRICDVYEDTVQIQIVLEYIEGTNLFHWIKQNRLAEEEKTRRLFKEICKIVSYMHSRGIVHRDIKLENIMMSVPSTSQARKRHSRSGSGVQGAADLVSSVSPDISQV